MLYRELWETFSEYAINAKWLDLTTGTWIIIGLNHVMQEGGLYSVQVSQSCTLTYNGVSIPLVEGWNEFTYGVPTPNGDIIVVIPLTLTIPPTVIEDIVTTIPLTLTIPSAVIEDIVATIPLTLTIPSIEPPPPPPPPPDDDWGANISAWLTENWYMAVAVIVIFLIGIFVWARYK